MKIKVADLLPNPFRHTERYPIKRDKVDALKRSIRDTSFWDNLLARPAPEQPGKFELAYGYHRLVALRETPEISEIDIPVREIDDTLIIKIMANENLQEWGHSAEVDQETIRAIVEGFAQDRIVLPPINSQGRRSGTGIHIAPSFVVTDQKGAGKFSVRTENLAHAYSIKTLKEFLNWPGYKIESALAGLALIELTTLGETVFCKLSSSQAQHVAANVRRVEQAQTKRLGERKARELARRVGEQLAAGMREEVPGTDKLGRERQIQSVTVHNARQVADALVKAAYPSPTPPRRFPNLDQGAMDLATMLAKWLTEDTNPRQRLDQIIANRESISDDVRDHLVNTLEGVGQRFLSLARQLNPALRPPGQTAGAAARRLTH
jgi:hypothetical protein